MKRIVRFLVCIITLSQASARAQDFDALLNVKMKTREDFKAHEKDFLDCANWLERAPLANRDDRWKKAAAFTTMWITDCPYVTVNVRAETIPFAQDYTEMFFIFSNGWVKYSLEHNLDSDQVRCNVAALQSVIKVYKANFSYKTNISIDKLTALNDGGKLEDWVRGQLK